ncbi:MAG: 2-oxo acid dehydrogenase subunit E2 [Kutzneria sp.]|nr:2-oxo acid dehydrogenase subunit E2 [Kutzneria sp.]
MPQFKNFPLPDVGEGLVEAEILAWHVKPGDEVAVNQIIVEIETAKAAVELPCPYSGVVSELLAEPGQTVDVGVPIVVIDTDPNGEPANGAPPAAEERVPNLVGYGAKSSTAKRRARKGAAPVTVAEAPAAEPAVAPAATGGHVPLAKPPVRKLAKELGIDLAVLAGSGPNGVITRVDVETAAIGAPVSVRGSRERRVPVKGVRKMTAQAMVDSAFSAPHVTEFLTVDVTPMMELRAKLKDSADFRGVRLTPLAFAAKAVCLAVRRTPDVNATWDAGAGEIVYKDYVHLGVAAATPRGLIVPNIRDADAMSLRQLAEELERLTTTARDGKTAPADMTGGTITITNVGVFGVDTGTPIINPGESAILAFGAIRDMPWVVGGQVVPRKVLQLALSFDHRVVDGQQGSQFLADVGALLADPAMAVTY